MRDKPKLSIVLPVCNEEQSLPQLYLRLAAVLKELGLDYEIIFIDDGSHDASWLELTKLHQTDHRVKVLSFSRNFGHMAALAAGLDQAAGDVVITMDADLQHPPELIPQLLNEWEAGAEVVSTLRQESRRAGYFKNLSARFFYWLLNRIAKINLPANAADFRLLDRKVVETLKTIKERSRFLRGLISWIGYQQAFVAYQAEPRFAGKTKYSFSRMFSFAIDGITAFSAFPLRLATYLGLSIAFFSFIYIVYAIFVKLFTNNAMAGWASVLIVVLFIGGVQLIFLGIIGEYLSRVFDETKGRPFYIVAKKLGW
ncbi:glycosyltransferase [Candidatus Saganbacteria bacterium CG08_land_8_20_14_0_20_45_16]|uniref:Glycosyltransferase n=1 Tax=Candidatus Saganbacteria bacterium CG08_land_8_20_14_0_20_45_16 TaxID=2014293 RepID=A0A2H0XT19_UNCSA|nr:MAG: glycosyltransferase [Candidatus Saganbacteria bacterium CG08_land_8_20_14_0_20_45_16]